MYVYTHTRDMYIHVASHVSSRDRNDGTQYFAYVSSRAHPGPSMKDIRVLEKCTSRSIGEVWKSRPCSAA